MRSERPYHYTQVQPIEQGIVFEREADGTFSTNIKVNIETGGSPDGFETGYNGSGPSALALNLVLEVLEKYAPDNVIQTFKYNDKLEIRVDVWDLYQGFKENAIAFIKLEAGDRYVMPIGLACLVLDVVAQEKGFNEIRWSEEIPGRESDLVDQALDEFRARFLKT